MMLMGPHVHHHQAIHKDVIIILVNDPDLALMMTFISSSPVTSLLSDNHMGMIFPEIMVPLPFNHSHLDHPQMTDDCLI